MFYLIDKPISLSSFDVIRKLRKILGIKKMGHTGTLDPLATGCLLIATDRSTKLIPLLEGSEKTYVFSVAIDGTSPSLDLGTVITYHEHSGYKKKTKDELKDFLLNQTEQIPPKYSALHIDGKRAYELARQGEDIFFEPRPISVRDVHILSFSPPFFTIQMRISSGGYVRSFAPIIGRFFGVSGGYIRELRRTIIHTPYSDISQDMCTKLEDISIHQTIERDSLFGDIETIQIDEDIMRQLKEGRIIHKNIIAEGKVGKKYFFDFRGIYASLVEMQSDGFHIIRNDI